jgi:hypothetical protein
MNRTEKELTRKGHATTNQDGPRVEQVDQASESTPHVATSITQ